MRERVRCMERILVSDTLSGTNLSNAMQIFRRDNVTGISFKHFEMMIYEIDYEIRSYLHTNPYKQLH